MGERSRDPVVAQFEHAVKLLAAEDVEGAQQAIATLNIELIQAFRDERISSVASRRIPPPSRMPARGPRARRSVERIKLSTFERDRWTCRFCGVGTIDLRVMKAVSAAFPIEFPYHPNWKFGSSHLLYWTHTSSLEHLVPFARGGEDAEPNFVTTCYACNSARGHYLLDELGWHLRPSAGSDWDGLVRYLPRLAQLSWPTA